MGEMLTDDDDDVHVRVVATPTGPQYVVWCDFQGSWHEVLAELGLAKEVISEDGGRDLSVTF